MLFALLANSERKIAFCTYGAKSLNMLYAQFVSSAAQNSILHLRCKIIKYIFYRNAKVNRQNNDKYYGSKTGYLIPVPAGWEKNLVFTSNGHGSPNIKKTWRYEL
jgi:hypothetical protein